MENKKEYWENFDPEELEIIKQNNPAQYALIIERLKIKVSLEVLETKKSTKSIMDFDDFI